MRKVTHEPFSDVYLPTYIPQKNQPGNDFRQEIGVLLSYIGLNDISYINSGSIFLLWREVFVLQTDIRSLEDFVIPSGMLKFHSMPNPSFVSLFI